MRCDHQWVLGPFYVGISIDKYSEIHMYKQIQHCKKCGLVRLPEVCWEYEGQHLGRENLTRKGKKE